LVVGLIVCFRPPQKLKFGRNAMGTILSQCKTGIVSKLDLILSQQKTLTKNNFMAEPILIFVTG